MRLTTKKTLFITLSVCLIAIALFTIYPEKEKHSGLGWNAGVISESALDALKSGVAFERAKTQDDRISSYDMKLQDAANIAKQPELLVFEEFNYDPLVSRKASFESKKLHTALSAKTLGKIEKLSRREYKIIQFDQNISRVNAENLRENGLEIVGFVPNNAYLVAFNKNDSSKKIEALAGVRFTGAIPEKVILDSKLAKAIEDDELDSMMYIQLAAHRGENMDGWEELLLEMGADEVVYKNLDAQPTMMLKVSSEVLPKVVDALLAMSGVLNIRHYEVPALLNYGSVWLLQSGDKELQSTPLFDAGLTGYGQIYAAVDSGLDTDACHFRYNKESWSQTFEQSRSAPGVKITNENNKVIAYYTMAGSEAYDDSAGGYHGTMTTGCAVGDNYQTLATRDDPGVDRSDGMAPAAKIVFQDGGNNQGYLYGLAFTTQYNINKQAYDSGARIHNDSYGLEGTSTSYDQDSSMLDDFCWEKNDYTIFFAAGNSGPNERTLGGEGSTAKNTICVGASMPAWYEDGKDLISFSSRGPTADGRLKPDIVAPGLIESATENNGQPVPGSVNAHGGQTVISRTDPPNNQCAVSVTAGTSFASPTAAGMGILVRQYFTDGFYPSGLRNEDDGFNPTSALVRAVVINSGRPLEGDVVTFNNRGEIVSIGDIDPIPSTHQGWGRITLDDALYLKGDSRDLTVFADIDNDSEGVLSTDDEVEYEIYVKAGKNFKVTLAWIDPNGTVGTGRTLVNDLDLEVIAPNGDTYLGNVGYVNNGSTVAGDEDLPDSLNNLEQVILKAPVTGTYKVRVIASSVPGNGRFYPSDSTQQGYALIATGDLGQGEDVSFPRLSAKLNEVTGGCDNDVSLDSNEVVTVVMDVINSGEGDSGPLTATVEALADKTDIDIAVMEIPGGGVFELESIAAKTRTTFNVQVGLGDYEGDLCRKVASFSLQISTADGELLKSTIFSVIMGLDYAIDGTEMCQEQTCNPPLNITDIIPSTFRAGDYGFNLTVSGQYMRDGIELRFEPDVVEYGEITLKSPTELLVKNVKISRDAEPGAVEILATNPNELERNFIGLLEVSEPVIEDGDLEDEMDLEEEFADGDSGSGSGSGCNSSGNAASVFSLFILMGLFFSLRRKEWTSNRP